jgi:hypothetical protein
MVIGGFAVSPPFGARLPHRKEGMVRLTLREHSFRRRNAGITAQGLQKHVADMLVTDVEVLADLSAVVTCCGSTRTLSDFVVSPFMISDAERRWFIGAQNLACS